MSHVTGKANLMYVYKKHPAWTCLCHLTTNDVIKPLMVKMNYFKHE